MTADEWGYDADLEDAQILVDRDTTNQRFTLEEIAAFLDVSTRSLQRQLAAGKFPAAEVAFEPRTHTPAYWTRRQLIEIVKGRLERREMVA